MESKQERRGILKDISDEKLKELMDMPLSPGQTMAGRMQLLQDLIMGTPKECECEHDEE